MDEIDVKILRCLKNNARENASVISEKVSMSVSAVIERIRKLENSGMIRQHTTIIDQAKAGKAAVAKANEQLPKGKLTVAKETRPIAGGFILKDNNVEVNCTFDTLVRLQRAETAGAVAEKLFPDT